MADDKATDATDSPYRNEQRPPASELVQRLIAEYGSADAALTAVAKERFTDRERVRTAEKKLKQLEEKVTKGRLLTEDEKTAYDAFTALGLTADKVKSLQTENTDLRTKDAERTQRDVDAEAAQLAGYTKPVVLSRLAKAEGFRVEVADDKEDGKRVRRAFAVKGDGDKAERTPLGEYVEANFADFLPALTAGDDKKNGEQKPLQSSPYPAQSPRGAAPAPKQKSIEDLKQEKRASGMYAA